MAKDTRAPVGRDFSNSSQVLPHSLGLDGVSVNLVQKVKLRDALAQDGGEVRQVKRIYHDMNALRESLHGVERLEGFTDQANEGEAALRHRQCREVGQQRVGSQRAPAKLS